MTVRRATANLPPKPELGARLRLFPSPSDRIVAPAVHDIRDAAHLSGIALVPIERTAGSRSGGNCHRSADCGLGSKTIRHFAGDHQRAVPPSLFGTAKTSRVGVESRTVRLTLKIPGPHRKVRAMPDCLPDSLRGAIRGSSLRFRGIARGIPCPAEPTHSRKPP